MKQYDKHHMFDDVMEGLLENEHFSKMFKNLPSDNARQSYNYIINAIIHSFNETTGQVESTEFFDSMMPTISKPEQKHLLELSHIVRYEFISLLHEWSQGGADSDTKIK